MATALHPVYSPAPQPFSLPRSVSIAFALALHAVLIAALFVPIAAPDVAPAEEVVTLVDLRPPTPVLPTRPPPPAPAVIRPAPRSPVATPTPIATPAAPAVAQDVPAPVDSVAPAFTDPFAQGPDSPGPGGVESLQVRDGSAPRYPREALRRGLQGEVELLVLVGVDGRVEDVSIARSSGHGVLDRSALEHVKAHWTFVPALRNGQPISAWARVPVRFSLPRGRGV